MFLTVSAKPEISVLDFHRVFEMWKDEVITDRDWDAKQKCFNCITRLIT